MKYIRTKDGVYEIDRYYEPRDYYWVKQDCEQPICGDEIIKQSDTIEELCDELVQVNENGGVILTQLSQCEIKEILSKYKVLFFPANYYGAIWTERELKFVAKLNEKGELELL